MFIDEAKIWVKGGDGGKGCVAFRREKHRPHGGPDGGDGGSGGNVFIESDEGLKTLMDFYYQKHFRAGNGTHGKGGNKHGKNGQDLILKVPCGTIIRGEKGEILADLVSPGQRIVVAEGGEGGRGNARFKTSKRQVPSFAEKGEKAPEKVLKLELKLLADVGLFGYPNVGKSTLISKISKAKPKIAAYPFTTKVPNLGLVAFSEERFVVADIPGLIEGAHQGKGLGDLFLRHIERTALLLHLIDLSSLEGRDPIGDFEAVNRELQAYSPSLAKRPQLVVGNKLDLEAAKKNLPRLENYFKKKGYPFFKISAKTSQGTLKLLAGIVQKLKERKEVPEAEEKPVIIRLAEEDERAFSIRKEKGFFLVLGKAIERLVAMTDLENEEALSYLQERFKRIGLERKLLEAGAKEDDTIKIGQATFDFQPS